MANININVHNSSDEEENNLSFIEQIIIPLEFFSYDPLAIAIRRSIDDLELSKKNILLYIDVIKYKNLNEKPDNDFCSICLDKYDNSDNVSKLECKHVFHNKCILEWGKYKPECPNCRKSIDYEIYE